MRQKFESELNKAQNPGGKIFRPKALSPRFRRVENKAVLIQYGNQLNEWIDLNHRIMELVLNNKYIEVKRKTAEKCFDYRMKVYGINRSGSSEEITLRGQLDTFTMFGIKLKWQE